MYSDGSTHFVSFQQLDRSVSVAPAAVFTNQASSAANTYQLVSLSTIVPPIAVAASGFFGITNATNGMLADVAGDANGLVPLPSVRLPLALRWTALGAPRPSGTPPC